MSALGIRQVTRRHGGALVLKGIDLEVDTGEFLILVGPSGCGKSTLLSIVAGLDAPTSGRVFIGERDVTDLPSKDRDIAMVFQSYALYPNMSVAQNMAFGLEIRKVPKPRRDETIARVAKLLQLEHLLDRRPSQLSGGQRQRVAMGRALAREPKLFLFDEPLSNLDAKLRVEMRAEIKLLHQRTRTTTVYVTHDQVEALTLGDRIAVMKEGAVQQLGTPDAIYARPATRFVAEFIGSPAMNFIDATRGEGGLEAAGRSLPTTDTVAAAVRAGSGSFVYGIRPEAVRLADDGWPAAVRLVEPTGADTFVAFDSDLGMLVVRIVGAYRGRPGDPARLAWDAGQAHVFAAATGLRVG